MKILFDVAWNHVVFGGGWFHETDRVWGIYVRFWPFTIEAIFHYNEV